MSRNKSGGPSQVQQRLPPSHPAEQFEEHRAFLIRSLQRNDKEIGALVDLTRSIRKVKEEIIQRCGELVLLDLGSGKIRLAPNGDNLEIEEDADEAMDEETTIPELDACARELCVDFLLRLKLRRKLLSRLFRRVNRVAHAMDGSEVNPPAPPRYGDLRIHIEPSEVDAYREHWKRQEAVLKLIEQRKEETGLIQSGSQVKDEDNDTEKPDAPTSLNKVPEKETIDFAALMSFQEGYEKALNPDTGDFKYTILDQPHEEDYVKLKLGTGIGAVQRGMTIKEKENECNRWRTAILSRIPEQPTYAELGMENRVFLEKERRQKALEAAKLKLAETKKRTFSDDNDEQPERGRKGGKSLRKLQEEKDAKDKMTPGSDVDAGDNQTQAAKDAAVETQAESDSSEIAQETANDEQSVTKEDTGSATLPEIEIPAEKGTGKEDEVLDNTEEPHVVKRLNPISLAPIPSFYEQDMKRIRMIHSELLKSSMQTHARQRLEEVILEYNKALQTSQQNGQRRQQVDMKLQQLLFEIKREQADYQMRLSVAKADWFKRLQAFNNDKLNKTLKTRWNQQPQGTSYTARYASHPDPIRKEVAHCGADIIDAVEMIAEGKIVNPRLNESFTPPADVARSTVVDPSNGLTLSQQRQRTQQHYKKESDTLAQQFRSSEEDRQRAWRRMLKVKAELNLSQLIVSNQRPVQVPVSDHNYHMLAMPNITIARLENVPREMDLSRSAFPSYVPAHQTRVSEQAFSDAASKYTIARVRARTSADGSVAPVSLPKRGPDGLFARPAGRTRKGMDWDAVNGKWVPVSK